MSFQGVTASLAVFSMSFQGVTASLAVFSMSLQGVTASLAVFSMSFQGVTASLHSCLGGWPRLSYRKQLKEGDEEADRGNDG